MKCNTYRFHASGYIKTNICTDILSYHNMLSFDPQNLDEFYFDIHVTDWDLDSPEPNMAGLGHIRFGMQIVDIQKSIQRVRSCIEDYSSINHKDICELKRSIYDSKAYIIVRSMLRDEKRREHYLQKYPALSRRTTFYDIYGNYLIKFCDNIAMICDYEIKKKSMQKIASCDVKQKNISNDHSSNLELEQLKSTQNQILGKMEELFARLENMQTEINSINIKLEMKQSNNDS
jgi:hypothetical protein